MSSMPNQTQTVQSYFMRLKIVPTALIAGPLFFLIAVLFISMNNLTFDLEQLELTYVLVLLTVASGAIFGGNMIYQSLISSGKNKGTLSEKANSYFTADLVKAALLEGGVLMSIVFVFLTGNLAFLIFWAFLIFVQVSSLPSKEKLIQDMQLTRQEIDVLNTPSAML